MDRETFERRLGALLQASRDYGEGCDMKPELDRREASFDAAVDALFADRDRWKAEAERLREALTDLCECADLCAFEGTDDQVCSALLDTSSDYFRDLAEELVTARQALAATEDGGRN